MVLLNFLGSYGNAVALQKIVHMMCISKGSTNDYVIWACNAISKHRDQVIKWPNNKEHRNMFDDNIVELDQEDELNQSIEHNTSDTRHNKIFAYMLEEHQKG